MKKNRKHNIKSAQNATFIADSIICYTHTQLFYGSMDFVRDKMGEPVPEETFTHSHLSWSSIVPLSTSSIQYDHNLGTTAKQAAKVWACAVKRTKVGRRNVQYEVEDARPKGKENLEIMEKDCQARKLNREDTIDNKPALER